MNVAKIQRKEVLILSKVSSKINRIKKKLDNISGLDDNFIMSNINKLDLFVDLMINDINRYLKEDPLNGTIFKKQGRSKKTYPIFFEYQTLHKIKVVRLTRIYT